MKKILLMLALTAVATGCAPHSTAPASPNNTFSNVAGAGDTTNTTNATNTTSNSTAASSGGDGLDTSSADATNQQMRKIAYALTEAYINSHNAKTAAQYQQEIANILGPGLVQFVAQAASSGTDYNHPVEKYDINVTNVQMLDQKNFNATVKANVKYKGAASTALTYHLVVVDYEGDWLIKLIR